MSSFEFASPKTLQDALKLFARHGTVRALAGGSDIIDQLKTGRRRASLVVDVKRIPELLRLEMAADGLHIGGARCCTDVHYSAPVRSFYAGLAEAAGLIGSVQIQNRAAIGGNVCNASPSADTIPALLAHEARAVIVSLRGRREVALADFFTGPGQTVLQQGEILQELVLPVPPPNSASAYMRFIPRNEMDIAVAGVASYLEMEPGTMLVRKARIALAAVAPTPVRARKAEAALEGRAISEDLVAPAGEAAALAASPITDVRGSAEYRRELVKVLTRRTLNACVLRITGDARRGAVDSPR